MYFQYGEKEINILKQRDKRLATLIERMGNIKRPLTPDLFTALVKNIIEQQISVSAAITVHQRLLNLCEGIYTPERIAILTEQEIQQCGMTMRKAGYIIGIANSVISGQLDLNKIPSMQDKEVIDTLIQLKGIGIWTAEMLLISSLNRPDILSWGDLAIQRGIMRLYHHKTLDKARFERYRKRYSPYGSTASLYLWALSKEPEIIAQ
ncbi:DNA-3-methyladenine glycosylase family protein [Proteus vulgaris]|uniref:DNA-3-methyladenine glycosylase family protein n=1 Tax=Proteus vulgaris TaxID=585 RepID=UPI000508B894|nr:DNA-3-methyladenine glycosylase [Proteus vulgaris]AYY80607.1 DNA-3-methyladenine glycosylase 2 family protein [Proteus vulgaris]KGA59817.1 hhH-GPD superbase excision DNA repair family protein [Proteus vulgaris]MBG5971972.1 DNA-3-methyladenine glycosylase 2 family protein [Proteus vulgaris]MBW3472196.1 DNA-3-methyladenine glycosylase [Proteus vulgaris]MCH4254623.1 DNA-3-methyladenine glycosylase [Proteus vulgaris]